MSEKKICNKCNRELPIDNERVLDLSVTKILQIGTDEQFVKLMDCKNYWLSNYGRVIHYINGKFPKSGILYLTIIKPFK